MPTTITSAGITFNDATSLTSANIGTAQLVNGSVTAAKLGTTEQKQIAKAWVNFDGTTSPGTIRSSYNVSSVTKNGTGDYTVTFTTAMADANYSPILTIGDAAANTVNYAASIKPSQTNSSFGILVQNSNGTDMDLNIVTTTVFGN
jgi:hypothetical protein